MVSNAYEKLRQARVLKKVTLKDLAKKCGLSYSYISQIERGDASPSLSSLDRLAKALDTTVWQLLKEVNEVEPNSENRKPVVIKSNAQDSENQIDRINIGNRRTKLLKSDMRRSIIMPQSNVRYQMITPDLNSKLQVILVEADAGSRSGEAPFEHEGEECCLILSGQVEMDIGDEKFFLETGDSIYFSSGLPHNWLNVGQGKISMLLVVTPPAY